MASFNLYQETLFEFFTSQITSMELLDQVKFSLTFCGSFTSGFVMKEISDCLMGQLTASGKLSQIELTIFKIITFSPAFVNVGIVMEFLVLLEETIISG